jgi:hypothetical protein
MLGEVDKLQGRLEQRGKKLNPPQSHELVT